LFLLLRALFLLLCDRCLQLLNFVIHGLALGCGTRVVRVHTIDAKLAESIHSNLTNGDAVPDLGVRGDTVDKAGSGTRKDAADAYDAGFVPRWGSCVVEGTSGIAEVNVLAASGQVLSCAEAHGRVENRVGTVHGCLTDRYVERAINVVEERRSANCRVADAGGVFMERSKTSGRVVVGIVEIERSITVGRVVVTVRVVRERITASGTIEKAAGVAKER